MFSPPFQLWVFGKLPFALQLTKVKSLNTTPPPGVYRVLWQPQIHAEFVKQSLQRQLMELFGGTSPEMGISWASEWMVAWHGVRVRVHGWASCCSQYGTQELRCPVIMQHSGYSTAWCGIKPSCPPVRVCSGCVMWVNMHNSISPVFPCLKLCN